MNQVKDTNQKKTPSKRIEEELDINVSEQWLKKIKLDYTNKSRS